MRNVRILTVATITLAALCLAVYAADNPVGKKAMHAKELCKMMDDNKMTLVDAITSAEEHCKGQALQAGVHEHEKSLAIDVYCVEGDKIMLVKVDGQTGKVTSSEEVEELGLNPVKKHEWKHEGKHEEKQKEGEMKP